MKIKPLSPLSFYLNEDELAIAFCGEIFVGTWARPDKFKFFTFCWRQRT